MTADTNSALLGLLLQGTGNNNNTWGANLNTNVIQLIENAIAESSAIATTGGTTTLSTAQARASNIVLTGTLSSDAVIVVPDTNKIYNIINNTVGGGFFTRLKCSTLATAVNIPAGGKTTKVIAAGGIPYRHDAPEVGRYVYDAASATGDVLECNGTAYLRASLPNLFAKIGTAYGNNDATDFKVPDAYTLGKFLRSRTAAVAVGTAQSSQNKSHTHTGSGFTSGMSANSTHSHTGSGTTSGASATHTHTFTTGVMNSNAAHTHTGSGTSSGASAGHTHAVSGTTADNTTDHTHGGSGTTSGESLQHTHTGTTDAPNVSLAHTHTYSGTTGGVSAAHTHVSAVPQQGNANIGSPITTAFSEGGNNKAATVLNVTSGAQSADHTHTYSGTTASDSGTLTHTHTFTTATNPTDHTHTYSFTTGGASAAHSHTFSVTSAGVSADHTHTYSFTTDSTNIDHTHSGTTAINSVDHTHTYSFTTSTADLSHAHAYSFTTSTGSADGTEARPESLVGILCIRY